MVSQKTHVYFMPGLAANPSIFKYIHLPEEHFEIHWLHWHLAKKNVSIADYAREMAQQVVHENAVLLGVSFGGILVQEMAKFVSVRKVIVVSSVKKSSEMPKRMRFAKYTKIHRLLPTGMVQNVEFLAKYAFGETVTNRLALYEEYLSIRDKSFLDWSIDQVVNWKPSYCPKCLVHIHGEKDAVFPIANIKNCIRVKNGTHTMIIHRAKWFNEHLPAIILE